MRAVHACMYGKKTGFNYIPRMQIEIKALYVAVCTLAENKAIFQRGEVYIWTAINRQSSKRFECIIVPSPGGYIALRRGGSRREEREREKKGKY